MCRTLMAQRRHLPPLLLMCAALLGVALGGVACQQPTSPPAHRADGITEIPILWQQSGSYSRVLRGLRVVARDQATLAKLPLTEVPVDFDSQMVLIAALGPTPSEQMGIRILRVFQDGSNWRVQEQQIHPGLGADHAARAASPWTVAIVPRSDVNIEGYSPQVPRGAFEP